MKTRIPLVLVALLTAGCNSDQAPTSPATTITTTAAIETFASFLAVGGFSAHTFDVSQPGTVTITLTSVNPPSTIVGVGIGIPREASSSCGLSRSVETTAGAGPQLSVAVDAGTYCVEIYDGGNITGLGVFFSMTIDHP